jgi:hypothetical protein
MEKERYRQPVTSTTAVYVPTSLVSTSSGSTITNPG